MILDDGFFKRSLATKVWPEGKKKKQPDEEMYLAVLP